MNNAGEAVINTVVNSPLNLYKDFMLFKYLKNRYLHLYDHEYVTRLCTWADCSRAAA